MLPFPSGRSGKLGAAGFLCVIVIACAAIAATPQPRPQPSPQPSASASPHNKKAVSVPLPVGQEAKGLVLPDMDLQGHTRGRFEAAVAKRIDDDHMEFRGLKMTTYTPQNAVDLLIEMPTSVLDLNTRVIVSHERATVQRHDFTIAGDQLHFDTVARKGTLSGNVKMVITDQSQLMKKPGE